MLTLRGENAMNKLGLYTERTRSVRGTDQACSLNRLGLFTKHAGVFKKRIVIFKKDEDVFLKDEDVS